MRLSVILGILLTTVSLAVVPCEQQAYAQVPEPTELKVDVGKSADFSLTVDDDVLWVAFSDLSAVEGTYLPSGKSVTVSIKGKADGTSFLVVGTKAAGKMYRVTIGKGGNAPPPGPQPKPIPPLQGKAGVMEYSIRAPCKECGDNCHCKPCQCGQPKKIGVVSGQPRTLRELLDIKIGIDPHNGLPPYAGTIGDLIRIGGRPEDISGVGRLMTAEELKILTDAFPLRPTMASIPTVASTPPLMIHSEPVPVAPPSVSGSRSFAWQYQGPYMSAGACVGGS